MSLDAEASAVVDLQPPNRARLYWGIGGIGKSTFALKVAHHPAVAARYRAHRYYVKLDGEKAARALEEAVAECLGIDGSDRTLNLNALLQDGTPRLIVLDTLDAPAERDRNTVDQVLKHWGGLKNVTLLVTARSPVVPTGKWIVRIEMPPLPLDAIRRVFLQIADRFESDPHLNSVLELADGMPLAAELLAHAVIDSDSVDGFLARWKTGRRGVFNNPSENRRESVHRTVAFSLNHSRLKDNEPARAPAAVLLADLPDGLFLRDLRNAFPDLDREGVPILRSVGGLARIGADRVTMLAPIREELRRLIPCDENDWKAAIIYMSNTVEGQSFSYLDDHEPEALAWFQAMQRNVEELLAEGTKRKIDEAVAGVQGIARFGFRLGIDYRHLLITAAKMATEKDQAVCKGMVADVLQQRGETDEALRIRREEELPVFERLGDVRAKAVSLGKIADVLQQRGETDEALRIYWQECLPVYERLGAVREKAITLGKNAVVMQQRGETDEALRIRREEELPIYERLGDVREVTLCRVQIAIILIERNQAGDRSEARSLLEQVLSQAQQLKSDEILEIRSLLDELGRD